MTREELKKCFDQWFDELRNYVTYRCCDAELATDIVQEAYVKIWEKNIQYHSQKTRGLLYKIANDLWVSHYRKSHSEAKYRLSLSLDQDSNDTENQLYYQELKAQYEKALARLPEKKRVVFLMNRMDEMTYSEIADRLNISVKAVEKRITQALQELRKILNHEKSEV
ncbi:MAG: sigma-70 family RNA polymerase sigma factor [Bacteroidota bacterium]